MFIFKQQFYCLTLLLLLSIQPVQAGQIYRYSDSNGVVVISRTLPPNLAGRGYEVLDSKTLHRISLVKPALTPYQILALQAGELATIESTSEQQLREAQYATLKADYANEGALLAERDYEMSARDKQLETAHNKQNQLEVSLLELQALAAQYELNGRVISKGVTSNIEIINNNLIINQDSIDIQISEYNKRIEWFAEKRTALREAFDLPALAESHASHLKLKIVSITEKP